MSLQCASRVLLNSSPRRATRAIIEEFGSLDQFLWQFADPARVTTAAVLDDLPTETDLARAMSKALKAHGFNFVGPTICYALMQSAGLVNDHVLTCFRHDQVRA